MVRLINPCMSHEARGALGRSIIYQNNRGVAYAKKYFTPRNPKSPAQIIARERMTAMVTRWKAALETTQTAWNDYAKTQPRKARGAKLNGYAWYASYFIIYMRDNAEAEPAAPFLPE